MSRDGMGLDAPPGGDDGRGGDGDEIDLADALRSVGTIVRRLRNARGMSGHELARRAQLSQPAVSQLERGHITPSLATLYRIAMALDVSPAELLADHGGASATVVRAGHGQLLRADETDGAALVQVLTSVSVGLDLEVYLFDLPAGSQAPETFEHAGEDFVYVLAGAVTVHVGDDRFDLEAGDALHHAGTFAHSWTIAPTGARLLLTVRASAEH